MASRTRTPRSAAARRRRDEAPTPPPPGGADRRRWTLLLLGAVVGVQLALGAAALFPAPHNGGDNAGYVTLAHALLSGQGYTELWDPLAAPHTKYPPVFPALLALVIALGGRTWLALKTVPLLSTTVAVAFAYLWATERRSPRFGAALALLLALAPAVVFASHWVLSDPTFLACTMVALWALERADRRWPAEATGRGPAAGAGVGEDGTSSPEEGRGSPLPWLVLGAVAALLAWFTRSAGLPLLAALGGWLLLRRRWTVLAAWAGVSALPLLGWWLRARRADSAAYLGELWLLDPYDPGLGRAGPGDMVVRVVENVQGYLGAHIPAGLVGGGSVVVPVLGLALVGAAAVGWGRRARARATVAELFTPLYLGLILVWPQVWSGDRFALPLYPLLLFYAGEELLRQGRRLGPKAPALVGAVAVAALALPATAAWTVSVRQASACAGVVEVAGPFACYGPRMVEFDQAARWAGVNLPDDARVFSRKPRIFYVLSGLRSRTYPFTPEPDAFLAEADALGVRYVLLDFMDRLGSAYVAPVVEGRPGAFCIVGSFGEAPDVRTTLLGLLPPGERMAPAGAPDPAGGVRLAVCPPGMLRPDGEGEQAPAVEPGVVPLLVR